MVQAGMEKRRSNRTEKHPLGEVLLSSGRNKHQSREIRATVREVLMEAWDPIGVRNVPEAQHEYDRYVGKVYVMLMDEHASEQAIATDHYDIEINYLGLSPSSELMQRSRDAANLIAGLRASFETH